MLRMLHLRTVTLASFLLVFVVLALPNYVCADDSSMVEYYNKPIELEGFKLYDKQNTAISLKKFAGKKTILNVWATWCASCVEELPDMLALERKYKGKFNLVALSVDRDFVTITKFLQKNNMTDLKVYKDKNMSVFKALQLKGVPTSFLLDEKGRIIARIEGAPTWNEAFLQKLFKKD